MVRGGYVYILTNKRKTVLYTGITSDIKSRLYDLRTIKHPGSFTARYNVTSLVYYEGHKHIEEAIDREKQIKAGPRKKKEQLIQSMNPEWKDLSGDF